MIGNAVHVTRIATGEIEAISGFCEVAWENVPGRTGRECYLRSWIERSRGEVGDYGDSGKGLLRLTSSLGWSARAESGLFGCVW